VTELEVAANNFRRLILELTTAVNQHRTGTPLAIGANTFIQMPLSAFWWVPIGADQDPPV
jgi:hypothetical protein